MQPDVDAAVGAVRLCPRLESRLGEQRFNQRFEAPPLDRCEHLRTPGAERPPRSASVSSVPRRGTSGNDFTRSVSPTAGRPGGADGRTVTGGAGRRSVVDGPAAGDAFVASDCGASGRDFGRSTHSSTPPAAKRTSPGARAAAAPTRTASFAAAAATARTRIPNASSKNPGSCCFLAARDDLLCLSHDAFRWIEAGSTGFGRSVVLRTTGAAPGRKPAAVVSRRAYFALSAACRPAA